MSLSYATNAGDIYHILRSKKLFEKLQQIYGNAPRKGLSSTTLEFAISYNAQARKYEAQPKETQQQLIRKTKGQNADLTLPQKLKPVARLVREWNRLSYVV